MTQNSFVIIIDLIAEFLKKKKGVLNLNENLRRNPFILHYTSEIIRYWSTLNFIIKKTLRTLNELGGKDREESSILFYITYRFYFEKASLSEIKRELLLNLPHLKNHPTIRNLNAFLHKLPTFSMKIALKGKSKIEKLSIKEAIPNFLITRLLKIMDRDFLEENIRKMNTREENDFFTVRINFLPCQNREKELVRKIKDDLKKARISFLDDENVPFLFHIPIKQKKRLIKHSLYKRGLLIIQNKASAVIVFLFEPQPREKILDMCTAPGIKINQIHHQVKSTYPILGAEFHPKRAFITKNLLKKLQSENIQIINTDSTQSPIRNTILFDKILLDAPCTGSGALKHDPELKWRQNKKFLYQNVTLQKKLLENALSLLRPDGTLLYSTCSLYPEEGELQIKRIVEKLEPLPLPKWISPPYKIKNLASEGMGRLFPSIHETDGFFIAKFKKKGEYNYTSRRF
ncbi:MAG: RsmB/NOP family class I SAM-dependent RNA methyltransferase [Promethearchaeota archaeon]